MDLKKLILNCTPKAVKFEGNSEEGFSVLVIDEKSDFKAWMDVIINDEKISVDWNQYIFYLDNEKDVFQRDAQNDCYLYEIFSNEATSFLEQINKISQDEDDNWMYI